MSAAPAPKVAQAARSSSPKEVLMSPVFWLLYIMFVMVSASGLMATAQIAPIAADFKVGNEIVQVGARSDGTPTRWRFTEITPNSFRWLGEALEHDGKSWKLEGEFLARCLR